MASSFFSHKRNFPAGENEHCRMANADGLADRDLNPFFGRMKFLHIMTPDNHMCQLYAKNGRGEHPDLAADALPQDKR
jgi:hypothetical protein